MPDETVVTAPAAPAPEAEGTAPVAPAQTATPNTQNARERREALRGRLEGRSVAARVNNVQAPHPSAAQPRNEQGQFAAPEPAAGTTPAEPIALQPAAAPAPVADGRIQLPESDPLRSRGKQFLDELAPHELRSFLKRHAPAVLADAETAQHRAQRLETELARERAATAAWKEQGGLGDPQNDPTYRELHAVDPKVAELYWKGLQADQEGSVNTKLEQAAAETQQQQLAEAGLRFLSEAHADIMGRLDQRISYHPAFRAVLEQADAIYDALAEKGLVQTPSVEDFWKRAIKPALQANPHLAPIIAAVNSERDAVRRAAISKDAAAAAEAKRKQELEALQATRRNNGHARLPAAANAGAIQAETQRPASAREIRENLNKRLRPGFGR